MLIISEFIAYAAYGVKVNRIFRIGFKVLAEGEDKVINGTG